MATKKLADAQEGDLARDTRTGIVYQLKNGEWVPLYREGQSIPNYLIDRAAAGFIDLPFVPSQIREYVAKRAEQFAPPPGTLAHTAGDVAEVIGGMVLPGGAWSLSAKGLTKLPWLRRAAELPWLKGLPARVAAGAGAGLISDVATRGHKMSPEEIGYGALLGGLLGGLFRGTFDKKKPPPVAFTSEGIPTSVEGAGAGDVQNIEKTVAKAVEGLEGSTSGVAPEVAAVPPPPSAPPPPSTPPTPSVPPPPPFSASQPWPPRPRYGPAFGNIGQSSGTFPYITRDDAAKLIEQIRRSTGATIPPLRTQPPFTPPPPPFQLSEVPHIRWGEGRGPLTLKEARKAASDIRKQLKGKRAVVMGGVPLLLDEDDIIHFYATQIANPE